MTKTDTRKWYDREIASYQARILDLEAQHRTLEESNGRLATALQEINRIGDASQSEQSMTRDAGLYSIRELARAALAVK